MIVCNGLTKRFPQRVAVDQISLAVEPGEICAVLGPNGAGKSTLIRMLCGLMRPDAGTALVGGFDPAARSLAFRRAIGVVPDQLALLPELTIQEQVSLCGPIYGFDGYVTKKRTEELLRLLGIWDTRQTLARECSHGMRKKTALAMALLHSPAVLILDEPFEGVDPAGAETIRTLLWSASRRGISILLTSHILSLVDRISDRVVMIREGQVVWDSPVSPESRQTAEQIYFQLVEPPVYGDLEWLQSSR